MKKLIVCLLAVVWCVSAKAQTPEKTKKEFRATDIYHGITGSYVDSPHEYALGYFLDLHMRKRLWLFTDYTIDMWRVHNTQPNRTSAVFYLYSSAKFAFRFNKENARFTYYPYFGFSFTPGNIKHARGYINTNGTESYTEYNLSMHADLVVGFEVKMRLGQKYNLGAAISGELDRGVMFSLKFGWNRQYKK